MNTGSNEKSLFCQIFDFTLDVEEMKSVTLLNKNWRYIVPMIDVRKPDWLFLPRCVTINITQFLKGVFLLKIKMTFHPVTSWWINVKIMHVSKGNPKIFCLYN